MMASRGLKDSPLFGVAEGPVTDDGLLPLGHVAEIRGWLEALAADAVARNAIVQQTVGGSIRILTRRVYPIADAAEDQVIAIGDLATLVERQYEIVSKQLLTATTDGTLLRGDLLTRWQEFVGSGELIRSLEAKVGFVRERLVNAIKGKPQQAERVAVAIETGLESLVVEHGEQAAARAAAAWRATPYGAQLVEVATEDLTRATRDLRRRADAEIQAWQGELQELVRSESGDVRTSARFLAVGVRGLAVTLAVVVLGGEQPPAAAADSLRLGARLLETVVGPGTAGMLRHRPGSRWRTGSALCSPGSAPVTLHRRTSGSWRRMRGSSCGRPRGGSMTCGTPPRCRRALEDTCDCNRMGRRASCATSPPAGRRSARACRDSSGR